MNTRTRTLQRMKKRASDSPVPKDYKERIDKKLEHIEKGLEQLRRQIDEELDRMDNSLHVLGESLRKVTGYSIGDVLQGRTRNEACDFAGATFSLHGFGARERTLQYAMRTSRGMCSR